MGETARVKFKVGDEVYSWQNPSIKGKILQINELDEVVFVHRVRLRLMRKDGSTYNSKWMNAEDLSRKPLKKKTVADFEASLRSLDVGDVLRKYGHEVSYGHIMMLENYRKEILG